MRKLIVLGTVMLFFGILVLPVAATDPTNSDIVLSIRGGVGVHCTVINDGETEVSGLLEIFMPRGSTNSMFIVSPGIETSLDGYPLGFFKPVTVTLSAGSVSIERAGYVIGIFVIFLW